MSMDNSNNSRENLSAAIEAALTTAEQKWNATKTDDERIKEAVQLYHEMHGVAAPWQAIAIVPYELQGVSYFVVFQVCVALMEDTDAGVQRYTYNNHMDMVRKNSDDTFTVIAPLKGGEGSDE